jgi:hypothetical protein
VVNWASIQQQWDLTDEYETGPVTTLFHCHQWCQLGPAGNWTSIIILYQYLEGGGGKYMHIWMCTYVHASMYMYTWKHTCIFIFSKVTFDKHFA